MSGDIKKDEAKRRNLDIAIKQIQKQYGKGAIMRMDEEGDLFPGVSVIPTGSLSLDIATGIFGYPRGRIVEIFGPESSGKTTLALHALAEAQKIGGICAFIDAEHALDVTYARNVGVNTEELLISQPDYGEQALEIADMLVKSQSVDLVVIDSVAALVPRSELEGNMGDHHVGLQARLMSQALKKLVGSISRSNSIVIFINQIRMKIGVLYGSPETTTGGNALKFYSSMRLEIRRTMAIKQNNQTVGHRVRINIVKNKLAPPFKQAELDIMYGKGISREGDLIDLGINYGLIERSGSWLSFGDIKLGQGKENAKQLLLDNPELAKELETMILEKVGKKRGEI